MKNQKGLSLVGLIVYMALLAIILPALVLFFLSITSNYSKLDVKSRITNSTSIILSTIQFQFKNATSFNIASSILGVDNSKIVFQNKNGDNLILESVTTTAFFAENGQIIKRLRLVDETASTTEWITDPDLNVDLWRVYAIRNSSNVLTGLNIELKIEGANVSESGFNSNSLNVLTTINLDSSITEI